MPAEKVRDMRTSAEKLPLTVVLAAACILAGDARAQVAAPSFAVSAIRPSTPSSGSGLSIKFQPGGTLVARNATLRVLIKIAYNLNDDQLSGGPGWAAFRRFDIDAKPDSPAAGNQTAEKSRSYNQLLMRSLLRDRFHLQLRPETRDMSIYALVVGNGGLKLKQSASSDAKAHVNARAGAIHGINASMDDIARELGDKAGHPVENMTGVSGRYDFDLVWTPDSPFGYTAPNAGAASPDAGDSGPDLFTAVQQQLGLKLEARKSSAPYEVIESVQEPAEN
jgi:uncharacterized protein (TIGR03435 family)